MINLFYFREVVYTDVSGGLSTTLPGSGCLIIKCLVLIFRAQSAAKVISERKCLEGCCNLNLWEGKRPQRLVEIYPLLLWLFGYNNRLEWCGGPNWRQWDEAATCPEGRRTIIVSIVFPRQVGSNAKVFSSILTPVSLWPVC